MDYGQPLIGKNEQLQVIAFWLIFLSVPILYITAATKWDVKDSKLSLVMKIMVLFLLTPMVMATLAMSQSIYATSTHAIMMIIVAYGFLWLVETVIWGENVKDAMNADAHTGRLAMYHFINIALVMGGFIGVIYFGKDSRILNNRKVM